MNRRTFLHLTSTAAALGNGCTIEGVSCSHEFVDFGENVIGDGQMQVSSRPGFGLRLK